jgi:hypothetical protein
MQHRDLHFPNHNLRVGMEVTQVTTSKDCTVVRPEVSILVSEVPAAIKLEHKVTRTASMEVIRVSEETIMGITSNAVDGAAITDINRPMN